MVFLCPLHKRGRAVGQGRWLPLPAAGSDVLSSAQECLDSQLLHLSGMGACGLLKATSILGYYSTAVLRLQPLWSLPV